jgi:hypothetical protein
MQQITDTTHSPGTIIVACASLARYSEFWISLESLRVPNGSRLVCSRGADFVHGFNEGIRRMLGDWVFILGDDHTFGPNILLDLLERNLDFVVPIVPRRDSPFVPVLMHGPISSKMRRYSWTEIPTHGLFKIPEGDSTGQAGAVVRKSVLDKIGDPWFEGGKLTPGRITEDMYFIQRLQEFGIPLYMDCEQILPHIANLTITPQRLNGRWYAGYTTPRGSVIWDEPEMLYEGHVMDNIRMDNIREVA